MAVITSLVTTLLASAASPNSRRRAQAAESTPWWDEAISTCLKDNPATGTEKLVISQTKRTRAVVTATGYASGSPKMLWLTDESGTIIQLRVSNNMSNTFDFPDVKAYPLSLGRTRVRLRPRSQRFGRGTASTLMRRTCAAPPVAARRRTPSSNRRSLSPTGRDNEWTCGQLRRRPCSTGCVMIAVTCCASTTV